MLRRYEALMLAVPEVTQDEARTIETAIESAVKESKGALISFERWGKYRLAYTIGKNDYGVYFLTRFESPEGSDALKEIKSLFSIKLHDIVVRSVITRLPDTGSLEYQRPKSLEESPTRDVKAFLKENQMEGLLSSVDKQDSAKKEAASTQSAAEPKEAPADAAKPVEKKAAPVEKEQAEAPVAQESAKEEN